MYKKSMSVIVVLCLLGMGSIAFGGTFGGPWSFQGDWHNTDTSMCKPAVTGGQTNDWYYWGNWGMQNNGNNGCAVTLFDCYIFLAVEAKRPEPCVSTWNPAYPGADANGYDLYATQVFVMPWSWSNDTTQTGFRMDIEGGNINCGRLLALAYNVAWPASWNAYPILDVNGGTVYTPGYRNFDANYPYDPTKWDDPNYPWVRGEGLWVGGGDPGTGENWGIVNIRNTGKIIVPRIRIMNGEVNIFEYGLLYDNNSDPNMFFISRARARNHINVAGGELRLAGDRLDQVSYYLAQNRLIPCDGHGDLHVDFNGFDTSVTATCTPDSAWNPNPIDGAIGVPLNKVLSWSAGPLTLTVGDNNAHAVYFGTDEEDVNICTCGIMNDSMTHATYNDVSKQLTVHIIFSGENNLEVECKSTDTTANFSTTTPNWTINSIITNSGKTYLKLIRNAPAVANEDVVITHVGSNDRGKCGHILLTVDDVVVQKVCAATLLSTSLCPFKGWQDACSYNPGALVMDTNYYWRVDEHNDVTIWKGNIWEFKSKGPQAVDPIPADLAVGIPLPIVLKWSAGAKACGAKAHAVYFGTSQDDVSNASVNNQLGCFKGYVADPVYKLSNLDFNLAADTNYYWRIDESNSCYDPCDVWRGVVWQVLSTNYYVVEDFDLYTDFDTMHAKWKMGSVPSDYKPCGPGIGPSNGVIDYDMNDGENKHMQYDYDDSYGESFSEVRFDANDGNASGSDWTGGGALPDNDKCRSLVIGLIGNVNNQANGDYDRMYAAIEDTAGNFGMVSNSESQAQRSFDWTQWFIDLNDFNDTASVNLGHIRYLYLGFGGRCLGNSSGLGGTGRVRFDDFRLYQKTCLPQFLPVGDFSGDCKVDYTDLNTMADAWLAKPKVISPVTNPGTTGLRLWYKFDETTGVAIADSSGNHYDGEVNCTPDFNSNPLGLPTTILWDPTGGYDGSSCFISSPIVIRDYNMMIDAGKGALSPTQTSITFSIWINGDTYMPLNGWARIISATQDMNAGANDENEVIEIECPIPRPGATACSTTFKCGVSGDSNSGSVGGMPLSAFAGSWQHYAFVRAGADGNVSDANYNKIYIYHNGERIVDTNALRPIFGSTTPYDGTKGVENFRLTAYNSGSESYYGKIDDFRVYNRALSQAEIGWLGTKGTGNVPFSNASNLKSSTPEIINFGDMALLAKNWLTFQSWPSP